MIATGAVGTSGRLWINADAEDSTAGATTEADGSFTITVPVPGDYRLYTWIEECIYYYREEIAANDRQDAVLVSVTDTDVTGISFRLPDSPLATCN